MFFQCWFRLILVILGFSVLLQAKTQNDEKLVQVVFPEPLTVNNFKDELSTGLHVVDFYSPYCSHCKILAPKWEEAYKTFHHESQKLNIQFSQVNCIESGDICDSEKIDYYPMIRLYGPSGYIKNFPLETERSVENLINFARTEAADPTNLQNEEHTSTSQIVSGFQLTDIIHNDKSGKGYLISFWPSKNMKSTDDNVNFKGCENCVPFQRTWNQISALVKKNAIAIDILHINCESHKSVCEEFGYKELVHATFVERNPGVGFIPPNYNVKRFWKYKNQFSYHAQQYIEWVQQLVHNSLVPEFKANQISGIISKDPIEFLDSPVFAPKVHIIYVYDGSNGLLSQRKTEKLAKYLKDVSSYPNAYLYKSNADILNHLKDTYINMLQLINYNRTEKVKSLNEDYLSISTISQVPTFLVFRDGDSRPYLYQPSQEDYQLRNLAGLLNILKDVHNPLLHELKSSTILVDVKDHSNQVTHFAVQVIDSTNVNESREQLNNLVVACYDYDYFRYSYIYDEVVAYNEVGDYLSRIRSGSLLESHETLNIADKFTKVDNYKLQTKYVDIAKSKSFFRDSGLSSKYRNYEPGDVILIDVKKNIVYDTDVLGNPLSSNSPFLLRESILTLNIPRYSQYQKPIQGRSVTFKFSFFDIKRVIFVISVTLLLFIFLKTTRKFLVIRKYKSKRSNGLLGNSKRGLKE